MLPLRYVLATTAVLVATAPFAVAQTYDELASENEQLRRRIAALETRFEQYADTDDSFVLWQDEEHDHDDHDHDHDHDHEEYFNEHDHGHQGEVCYDYLYAYESHGRGEHDAHGHAGHTSVEGYPFLHGIRTEIDFIERALEFEIAHAEGADDGMVDETEFEVELVWAINNRMIIILGAPMAYLDPVDDANTSGFGDMEVGIQFLAFNGERDLLFFALFAGLPTGDADRDLGNGFTVVEPAVLWLHDFGGGNYFQSRFGWEIPVSTEDVGSEFRYDMGMYHTFLSTECNTHFRWLTAAFEVNGVSAMNGPDSGETVVDLTTGLRWVVRDLDEIGFGWSFPVTGTQGFENELIFSYRRHF